MRTEQVNKYPKLLVDTYTPESAIFDGVVSGQAWWGLEGIYGKGNGPQSIDGPSEESRFLLNPYLLVGLAETMAWISPQKPFADTHFYPVPQELFYVGTTYAQARYDVSNHFSFITGSQYKDAEKRQLTLIGYNASDFGFRFIYVDPEKSQNVHSPNQSQHAINNAQMLHLGGSCGYTGGCNNMSPYIAELIIQVPNVPARAYIKLWKEAPANVRSDPDMTFVIDMN